MKKKIYFMIMLVTCLSIATPALASGPFHDTVDLSGDIYVGSDGNCYQDYYVTSHFLWIGYNKQLYSIEVSCVQTNYRSTQ
jgi:hypothetical protein